MSEASIRTQWKKGQSGNPKGRPKKSKPLTDQGGTVTYYARWLLDQPCHLLGGGRPVTRQTRFLLDILERAELGELPAVKLLFDFADRGDRRRMQALRAARRAKTKDEAAFERRNAERVSPRTPGLRPDQEHLIKPARQLRTEHLKPAKAQPKKSGHQERYCDEYHLEQLRISSLQEKAQHLKKQRMGAEAALAASQRAYEAASKSGAETGPETGIGTGVKTGPITGLQNGVRPQQAIDVPAETGISASDSKNFVVPGSLDGASLKRSPASSVP